MLYEPCEEQVNVIDKKIAKNYKFIKKITHIDYIFIN